MDTNTAIAILGIMIGIFGASIGTFIGFRYHKDPTGTRFHASMAIALAVLILAHLSVLFLSPPPWSYVSWGVYSIALPLFLVFWNKKQPSPSKR